MWCFTKQSVMSKQPSELLLVKIEPKSKMSLHYVTL